MNWPQKESVFKESSAAPTDALDAWFTPGRFAGMLALLIVAAFPDVVSGAGTFFLRDYGIFTYPLAYYQRQSFWRGELPLWNSLSSCGVPFLAQWGTLTLYPPALFYLLFPLSWALGVFCLLHLFLGGLGMYRLAHRWTGVRFAAAVAGVVFAFNGAMLCCLTWTSTIAGLAWMPWVTLEVERAWRDGGRRIVIAAWVGALQMLSGAPEVVLLTWLVAGAVWIGGCRISDFRFQIEFWRFARLVAVVGLVAGIAAAQLLPFFDLLAHSQRGPGFGDSAWAMPVWGWANFLVPLFHCYPSHQGVFVQSGQYWLASYYLGIGVPVLSVLAIGKVRRRRVWMLAVLILLSLTLALGDRGYLYRWLHEAIPQVGFMRYPIKCVLLAMFLAPLLSAFGVHGHIQTRTTAIPEGRRLLLVVATATGLLIVALLAVAHQFPFATDRWPATWKCGAGRIAFLILVVGALVAVRTLRGSRQGLAGLALLVLLWLDVLCQAPRLNPTIARRVYEPGWARTQLKLAPEPRLGGARVMPSPAARAMLFKLNLPDAVDDYLFSRLGFLGDCNLLDDIPKLESFYPLYPREVETLRAMLYATTNGDLPRLEDFLGVSHITAPDKMIDWQARPTFLPLITGGQKPAFADDASTLQALASPAFDSRRWVYLPPQVRSSVTVSNASTIGIRSPKFASQSVAFTAEADRPAMLVIAQTYYHLWQATVDGRRVPLWRANFGFQALEVPAGSHRVELAYRDPIFWTGAAISGIALIGCLFVWLRARPGHVRICGRSASL
ncbi:MAG: YfhO family protein [Verrucomicrobia bacterium]|nr:YfhO family protein [Verrucomicrobiota bacterium]